MQIKNIKFNWKTALIIGFIITIFSGCEVQAVTITEPNPPTIEVKSYTIEELSEIINDLYGLNVDLSTFENSERLLNITNTTNKGIYITEFKMSMNSTEYYPLITTMGTDGTPPGSMWYYTNSTSSVLKSYCMIPFPNYTISGVNYVIDTVNNSIKTPNEMLSITSIDIWNYNNVFKYLKNSNILYQQLNGFTKEQMQTDDFKKYAFFEFWDWYSGGWSYSTSSYDSSNLLNKQISNKLSYWDYTEDGVYSYWSGDINLYDDYFEVVGFETNVSNYSMYLLRYSVGFDQYGEYYVTGGYEWENISKPNQGGTSKWQIGNLFGETSGDKIYAIGIGTEERPDLLRSEWFDSDHNISGFMVSDSFRVRYYVEDLPNFFLQKDVSGGGNLGQITNPSGDVTGSIDLGDIVSSGDTMAGSMTLEDITSKIDLNIINNPYTELWDTIINGFKTALTSRNPKSISFNIRETEVVINSNDIMLPQNEIKVFISLFTNTAMLMAIFIQIQKIIIKAQEGDISSLLSVTDEDIHFYNDMQMM